jgi:hypothetical protein
MTKRPASLVRLGLGAFLLLAAAYNSGSLSPPTQHAEAVGRSIGLFTLIGVAVWLIASGLPRTAGISPDLQARRRRIWFRLVAMGFPLMVVFAVGAAYFSMFVVAVLITWAYWFGWTIVAWRIADRRAAQLAKGLDLPNVNLPHGSSIKRATTPTTKIVAGLIVLLFQVAANRGGVVACMTAECVGYNIVGLGLWALGAWFLISGVRDWRAPSRPTLSRTHFAKWPRGRIFAAQWLAATVGRTLRVLSHHRCRIGVADMANSTKRLPR